VAGVVMPLEFDIDRPFRYRSTARVVLLDPAGDVLLVHDSDPFAPGAPSMWITPGGGIDPGETPLEAAVREVSEETGLVLDPAELRGPVAERDVVHGYSDKIVRQTETFFVATTEWFEPAPAALTDEEHAKMLGLRWWNLDELRFTDAVVWPLGMVDLVVGASTPEAWPLQLSTAEESSVPAGITAQ
jgi:8-oxo-dGTP pyrophosphatase MutT (NUDIX family)